MLKFAIVGCGAIGSRHALQASTFGKLQAVCDIIENKAVCLAKEHGTNAYVRVEDMLMQEKEVYIVAVCTPNGLHAEHSILALRAGFHVICEKPMAINSEDCREMIKEAGKAGKSLFVVKQNRFNPPVVAVKKMLKEGKLGRIFSVQVNGCWNRGPAYYRDTWHGTREMDGGILYTQFSHFIDLLYWMIGDVKEVYAFADNFTHQHDITFEDAIVASLQFENGAIASLHFTINSYEKNMEGSVLIVAEKATVKIGGQYLNTLEYLHTENRDPVEPSPGNSANDYGTYKGSMSNHDKMYEHVTEVLTKGYLNQFHGQEGLKTVEIIEKIYRAAK